jgi:hypothetical protein
MTGLEAQVYDVIRARSSWNRKGIMEMNELCNLIATRFGVPRPRQAEVTSVIRRLVRNHRIQWAHVEDGNVWFLM